LRQKAGRDYDSVYLPETSLRNVYYSRLKLQSMRSWLADERLHGFDDVPAGGNHWLLHDVLREEWGFQDSW